MGVLVFMNFPSIRANHQKVLVSFNHAKTIQPCKFQYTVLHAWVEFARLSSDFARIEGKFSKTSTPRHSNYWSFSQWTEELIIRQPGYGEYRPTTDMWQGLPISKYCSMWLLGLIGNSSLQQGSASDPWIVHTWVKLHLTVSGGGFQDSTELVSSKGKEVVRNISSKYLNVLLGLF